MCLLGPQLRDLLDDVTASFNGTGPSVQTHPFLISLDLLGQAFRVADACMIASFLKEGLFNEIIQNPFHFLSTDQSQLQGFCMAVPKSVVVPCFACILPSGTPEVNS